MRQVVSSLSGENAALKQQQANLEEQVRALREAVAAELFVHAQTVRYRMTQLRELYGDRLNDPQTILELTVALGAEVPSSP